MTARCALGSDQLRHQTAPPHTHTQGLLLGGLGWGGRRQKRGFLWPSRPSSTTIYEPRMCLRDSASLPASVKFCVINEARNGK